MANVFGGDSQNQIEVLKSLKELKSVLESLSGQLKECERQYNNALRHIRDVDANVANTYIANNYTQDARLLQSLLRHIEEADMQFIDQRIRMSEMYLRGL